MLEEGQAQRATLGGRCDHVDIRTSRLLIDRIALVLESDQDFAARLDRGRESRTGSESRVRESARLGLVCYQRELDRHHLHIRQVRKHLCQFIRQRRWHITHLHAKDLRLAQFNALSLVFAPVHHASALRQQASSKVSHIYILALVIYVFMNVH